MLKTSLEQFIEMFRKTIEELTKNKTFSRIIFLCIGTDRIIGDSFGPIVGNKLKKTFHNVDNATIIGDLENNICNTNIGKTVYNICNRYSNPFIISIDSALSKKDEDVGKIIIGKGGITIGSGLGRNKYYIGDMHIKGVIAKDFLNPRYNFQVIQNLHLNNIVKMADIVANGIYNSIEIVK